MRMTGLPAALKGWIESGVEQMDIGSESVGHIKLRLKERRPDRTWVDLAEWLRSVLNSLSDRARYICIIDEFPIFVDVLLGRSEEEGIRFLRWFRAARQSITSVRFLLGGSINVEARLARLGESALLNDLEVLRVRPFPEAVADRFVMTLLRDNLEADEPAMREVTRSILEHVGQGVPFYLQLVTSQVVDAITIDGMPLDADTVRSIYEARVLGPDCRLRFDHYRSRLREYYTADDQSRAHAILDLLSDGGDHDESEMIERIEAEGAGLRDEVMRVVEQLETDFYVERVDGRVRFLHRILADWWRLNIRPYSRRR
jgi:hypothetical protein